MQYQNTTMMKARKIMILLAACLLLMSNGQAWGKTRMLQGKQQEQKLSATARSLARQGYVNIKNVDKSIQVSLMYARADNFCGKVLYGDLKEAYLHPKAAKALKKAQTMPIDRKSVV